jgi:hypothetical protein
MICNVFFYLFYPWIRATLNVAYNLYLAEVRSGDVSDAELVQKFMRYHLDDYMSKAFKNHWFRIIFAPHTIITSPELYEHRVSPQ